jgi:hypothetical protein
MKFVLALATTALLAAAGLAADVEIAGMKSKTPAGWKEEETTSEMRLAQFKLPKAEGDDEDAQLIIFYFRGGSGTAEQNMQRQLAKFTGKPEVKIDKIKVGPHEAPYQDVKGTYLLKKRPFDPKDAGVEKKDYRQLYVPLVTDKGDYYPTLVGPAKTVEKHKKEFEEFLKNFK